MTFELVRMGWPNTAAIVALAMMPIVALTTTTGPAGRMRCVNSSRSRLRQFA